MKKLIGLLLAFCLVMTLAGAFAVPGDAGI